MIEQATLKWKPSFRTQALGIISKSSQEALLRQWSQCPAHVESPSWDQARTVVVRYHLPVLGTCFGLLVNINEIVLIGLRRPCLHDRRRAGRGQMLNKAETMNWLR